MLGFMCHSHTCQASLRPHVKWTTVRHTPSPASPLRWQRWSEKMEG